MTFADPAPTRRYAQKRELILTEATRLFNARGLKGTNIADIAETTGLTTTSITYYYRKKEDLAAACILRGLATMDAFMTEADAALSPPEKLSRFIAIFCAFEAEVAAGDRPPLVNFWDLRGMTDAGGAAAGAAFSDLFRRFRRWFADAALPRPEQNARAHLVFSAVLWAKEWLAAFDPDDFLRAGARLTDVLVGGLAGPGAAWSDAAWSKAAWSKAAWSDTPALPVSTPAPEVSREAFLRAATELINERGYRGASVTRISAKLKVTKGSFYHHNATKDDLVTACFHRTFAMIREAHRTAPPETGSGWDRLCAVAGSLVRTQLSARGPLLRYSALAAMPEATRPALVEAYARLTQRTAGILADGIADGSIRPVDTAVAAQVVTGMINAAAELHHWVHGADETAALTLFARPALLGVFAPAA